ncbi:FKBP12-associated protein [Savitreella phatthalungensis]
MSDALKPDAPMFVPRTVAGTSEPERTHAAPRNGRRKSKKPAAQPQQEHEQQQQRQHLQTAQLPVARRHVRASQPASSADTSDAEAKGRRRRLRKPKAASTSTNAPSKAADKGRVSAAESLSNGTLAIKLREAETILERLQIALAKNDYECNICLDTVRHNQQTWADRDHCWAVFHLKCIRQWAEHNKQGDTATWRCPACQGANTEVPEEYTCFCGREIQPEHSRLHPHSCGSTCGRDRSCPHPCPLQCHPGPCPPCTNMAAASACWCGRSEAARRCVDTDYAAGGWSCGKPCEEPMPCDRDGHVCQQPCHPGLCGACEVLEDWSCYCGRERKELKCASLGEIQHGWYEDEGVEVDGAWQCAHTCDAPFACGKHSCKRNCHSRDKQPSACPREPRPDEACPCGKTQLKEPRTTCEDAIPSCDIPCAKQLACGHTCEQICCPENEVCPPCKVEVELPCACESQMVKSTCQDAQLGLQPACERVCRTQLTCKRHVCSNTCCSGLPAAKERLARLPKSRKQRQQQQTNLQALFEIESEHICTRTCGRTLSCGQHACGVSCHEGPCPSCLVASFDDVTCHCGRTRITAPVRCGTPLPSCTFQCNRPTPCGHPRVQHHCHPDPDGCPRCVYLTDKVCVCGQRTVRNVPCWRGEVSCGSICREPMGCGHLCRKVCHAPGDHEDCKQACGKPKECGHPCTAVCHPGIDCPTTCAATVQATCECGHLQKTVRCGQPKLLPCDATCEVDARSRQLAEAFDVQASVSYEDATLDFFARNRDVCLVIEGQMKDFMLSDAREHIFKPMRAELRSFIHQLADVWRCHASLSDAIATSTSQKSVQLLKWNARPMPIPSKLLDQALADRTQPKLKQLDRHKGRGYNALVLPGIRFGATREDLVAVVGEWMSHLTPKWGGSGDDEWVALVQVESPTVDIDATSSSTAFAAVASQPALDPQQLEVELAKRRPTISEALRKADLAEGAALAWIDPRSNILKYRDDVDTARRVKAGWTPVTLKTRTSNPFDALA